MRKSKNLAHAHLAVGHVINILGLHVVEAFGESSFTHDCQEDSGEACNTKVFVFEHLLVLNT